MNGKRIGRWAGGSGLWAVESWQLAGGSWQKARAVGKEVAMRKKAPFFKEAFLGG